MSQPRDAAKQKRIRVFGVGYDASLKDATEQEPDRVVHATGTVNVEEEDLESAVKRAKKIVPRLHPGREVAGVAITGATVIADVVVET